MLLKIMTIVCLCTYWSPKLPGHKPRGAFSRTNSFRYFRPVQTEISVIPDLSGGWEVGLWG
jgi:hypothetical protein